MERQELMACLKRLAGLYPGSGQFDNKEGISEWLRAFSEDDYQAMDKAISIYIEDDTSKFAPTIGEIKQIIREKTAPVTVIRKIVRDPDLKGYVMVTPTAIGYRDEPIHNCIGNVEPDPKRQPIWQEFSAYPAYPWKFADFEKIGDGKDSQFIPKGDPHNHLYDDAESYWRNGQASGALPKNRPAPYAGEILKRMK